MSGALMGEEEEKKKDNLKVWFSLKKSLHCKSAKSDVHTPKTRRQLGLILTRKTGRSGCSRSISNLKDVIHGSTRHLNRPPSSSPRSIGSSEFVNPIAHEVILSNSRCELKITGFDAFHEGVGGGGSTFVGTLRPGTPEPGGHPTMHYLNPSFRNSLTPPRKTGPRIWGEREKRSSFEKSVNGVSCRKCGEQFSRWEVLESHHLSKHAVTELMEGDSSRKIVEIICGSSWLKPNNPCVKIDRVLKVHNTQRTLTRFEEYRESVKSKAAKLPKKHPRCLADGNELLRFYGTTLSCPLVTTGPSSLCASAKCSVCRIIRNGFSEKTELRHGVGVYTTSTSERAFKTIEVAEGGRAVRKVLIVCRVVAGRVHRPMENVHEMAGQTGFDSLAGSVGVWSNMEELYLLDPKALLPCFVVICKG